MLEKLRQDLKESMLVKDVVRTMVLRSLITATKNLAIEQKKDDITEEEFGKIARKQVKQRQDSIEAFRQGGRDDLVVIEKSELKILEKYVPQMMSIEQVVAIIKAKKEELGVHDRSGFGKLMGAVMGALKGQADGTVVKEEVNKVLS